MKKLVYVLCSIAFCSSAYAGNYTGMVRPFFYSSFLYLDASSTQISDRPSCATRTLVRLQETENDSVFKSKFAILLSSWIAGTPVTLGGTGQCTSEGDEIIFTVGPT